ncbi:galactokinase family protein [Kouleothrix sp.]|uniref:GHMP family kinase ATP-binding protein n=1 Tax=Kouleothrix sp. TaxID=2779161 RepID=UPI003919F2DF
MWRYESALATPDAERFLATLNAHAGFFAPERPVVVGRAPGRLDLMGGIADYSGALVLELPLALATFAAVQGAPEPAIVVRSLGASDLGAAPEVAYQLADLGAPGRPIEYAAARALFGADARASWAAYVLGCLVVLMRERGLAPAAGLRILVGSEVPPGKGVSSSAAIEVAAMAALAAHYGLALGGRELAILCQRAENLVVGAPCGVMDQMTAACGQAGSLMALLCQPAELQAPVALPRGLEVWGIDSGISHAVSGADYGSVRVGAFMGYRIIADLAGLPVRPDGAGRVAIDDARWGGYLANIAPSLWEQHFRARVPERIGGAEFLERYGGFTDAVTRVEPSRGYAVRQPTAHPIYEHARVRLFRALLERLPEDEAGDSARAQEAAELLGELMYQSHASYSACGLGADGTDRLVELARAAGVAAGVYGAKITGGGSGGTVALLARAGSEQAIRAIAAAYARESGQPATLIGGSSPGAAALGTARLAWGEGE